MIDVREEACRTLAAEGKSPEDLNPISRAEWEAKIAAASARYYAEIAEAAMETTLQALKKLDRT